MGAHLGVLYDKVTNSFFKGLGLLLLFATHLFAQQQITVRPDHPRIWINAENIDAIRNRNLNGAANPYWLKIKAIADNPPRGDIWDAPYLAFAYLITGDTAYARRAIEIMKKEPSIVPGDDGKSAWRPAVAFDWTYNAMSEEDRQTIIANFDSSKYLNTQWLDDRLRPIDTFVNWRYHIRFAPAMLGLALAGEHPNGYKALMVGHKQYEDGFKIFENIFPDGEWTEGFHYRKHAYKFMIAYFKALKTAAGIDYLQNSKAFRNTGYAVMYGTRPDNTYSRLDNIFNVTSIGTERSVFLMINEEYRDPHYQWYLNHTLDFAKFYTEPNFHQLNPLLMGALFYDDSIPESPPDGLPLAYHCRGWGTVFMRSGWNGGSFYEPGDDVFIEFYSGDYYSYHNHLASNTFNIYYQGGLVVENGGYGVTQTVGHNTILVYDPNEVFAGLENDGGQMWLQAELVQPNRPHDYQEWLDNPGRWETGDVSRFETHPDYTYIYADAAFAYRLNKVREFTRQFVYFRPKLVVVYDRVSSTDPTFQKSWLLHFIQEPTITGNDVQVEGTAEGGIWEYDGDLVRVDRGDGFRGRLFSKTLLPQDHRIQKIGGAGYEYWFNNQNHSVKRRNEFEEISNWRIEVEPTIPQKKDIFLHVLSITDTTVDNVVPISLVESSSGDPMQGAFIDDSEKPRLAMFAANATEATQFSYILSNDKMVGHLLCDLPISQPYEIIKNGRVIGSGLTSRQGTVYFEDVPDENAEYSFQTGSTVSVEDGPVNGAPAGTFVMSQNYPNPFNPATKIQFSLPTQTRVNILVYNVLGERVKSLLQGELKSPGWHSVLWDGTDDRGLAVGSGIYVYRITAGDFEAYKKMLLIR